MTVALSGDYGKPRPALVIQSDALLDGESVLVCLLTTSLREAPLYRLSLSPGRDTGLREPSQLMVDKIMAVGRDKGAGPIGRIDDVNLLAMGRLLSFMIGLAD